ncbi:MAG: hypothetical protein DYG89_33590 [Caldilinea sp. CFX5]|nr:hypothetical protein [Caldilinea sp. CFX5]
MDSTTLWIIIAVVVLLALFLFNRNRTAPRGTYDQRGRRSSGSIGGGNRAYNDPEHESRGSIGGSPNRHRGQNERRHDDKNTTRERIGSQRKHDDERFKSKGSIGG